MSVLCVLAASCEGNTIGLVAKDDDQAADSGRSSLVDAVVLLSKTPDDPLAYAVFAKRVEELRPLFSRETNQEAELRLSFLAIAPLAKGLELSPAEQMNALATTVWPVALGLPVSEGESAHQYVRRLCLSSLALDCKNVVPEYWPLILSAKVWRTMKSRAAVAHGSCHWCGDDPTFKTLLTECNESHLKVELLAKDAQKLGQPSAWPQAGQSAQPLETEMIVSVRRDGWVTIKNRSAPGGDWRQMIADLREQDGVLGFHMPPERMVGDLLALLADAKIAGYPHVALVTRDHDFPYDAMQYLLKSDTKSYQSLGVRDSDTIQILVQALDLAASKSAPNTPI